MKMPPKILLIVKFHGTQIHGKSCLLHRCAILGAKILAYFWSIFIIESGSNTYAIGLETRSRIVSIIYHSSCILCAKYSLYMEYDVSQKLDSGLRWIFWRKCDGNIA